MQNSPTAVYLAGTSLHERIMLASLLKCVKRDGVEEVKWGEVSDLAFRLFRTLNRAQIRFNINISYTRMCSQVTETQRENLHRVTCGSS